MRCIPLCTQLTERRKGNDHFRSKRFAQALAHYETALNIVNFVVSPYGRRHISIYDVREVYK